jgi:two-component system nitrate/nitrite response regulator NarL
MMHTVLIVDDHPLFRRGVAQLLALEPDVKVVGEAAHGAAALELAAATNPDLILLDLELKRADGTHESGIDVLRALKAQKPARPVVLLTVSDAADDLVRALRASADGYLLKDTEPEDLLARVRDALTGQTVISAPPAGRMACALRAEARGGGKPRARDLSALTEREQAVLRQVAEGAPNRRIAEAMSISEATVKAHLKHVMRKLNFRSRVEAAVFMADIRPRGDANRLAAERA